MQLSDFDYQLPKHLIAQTPKEPRDSSRLMVLQKGEMDHRTFRDFIDYLEEGDVLVLNDSKVLPARLSGKKETGGKVEVLLITRVGERIWEGLVKGKNIKENTRLIFGDKELKGMVISRIQGGRFNIEFDQNDKFNELIKRIGIMPTPPYIKEVLRDQNRYQTVYAKEEGSIAAPTAGLHFTEDFLSKFHDKGIRIVKISLHVSVGTFLPVKKKYIEEHKMEPENFRIDAKAAERINSARKNNK